MHRSVRFVLVCVSALSLGPGGARAGVVPISLGQFSGNETLIDFDTHLAGGTSIGHR
jgi:hypothetical protein